MFTLATMCDIIRLHIYLNRMGIRRQEKRARRGFKVFAGISIGVAVKSSAREQCMRTLRVFFFYSSSSSATASVGAWGALGEVPKRIVYIHPASILCCAEITWAGAEWCWWREECDVAHNDDIVLSLRPIHDRPNWSPSPQVITVIIKRTEVINIWMITIKNLRHFIS